MPKTVQEILDSRLFFAIKKLNRALDKLYEEALALGDCVQKDQLIARMVKLLDDECVWIWEGFPVSFALHYNWLENSVPHDFSFVRWKYLSVNDKKRTEMKKKFKLFVNIQRNLTK